MRLDYARMVAGFKRMDGQMTSIYYMYEELVHQGFRGLKNRAIWREEVNAQ